MKSHSQSGQMNKLAIRTPGISPAFNLRDKPVYIKGVRGRCKLARKIHRRLIFAALIMYHLSVCKLSTRL
jgi:hypothetical protein|nr:MAG TPA: hypothetical protein [Caudoviricetes sp.]